MARRAKLGTQLVHGIKAKRMTDIRHIENPTDAAPLLKVLRNKLDDASFEMRLTNAVSNGYRLLGAFAGDDMVGVLGYRLVDDLCWGRTFYIDDLVVHPDQRGSGVGAALLNHANSLASGGCDCIRLCSGLTRSDAHRFYEANGLERFSLQFVASL